MSEHVKLTKFMCVVFHYIFAVSVAVRHQRPEVAGVAGFTCSALGLGAVGTRCWNMLPKVIYARESYKIAPQQPLSPKDKTAEYDGHLISRKTHVDVSVLSRAREQQQSTSPEPTFTPGTCRPGCVETRDHEGGESFLRDRRA